jgi:hypothetical protein
MKLEYIYSYEEFSFDTGNPYERYWDVLANGFEIEVDLHNEIAYFETLKGFGDFTAEIQSIQTPEEFILWLDKSKQWIDYENERDVTSEDILDELKIFIKNQFSKVA